MKRTPLKRTQWKRKPSNSLKRSQFKKKPRANPLCKKPKRKSTPNEPKHGGRRKERKNGNAKLLRKYHRENPYCIICQRPAQKTPHHFGLGANRIDDVRCIGSVCCECHREYHAGYDLADEVVWWFKQLREPENFDLPFLWKIRPSKTGVYPLKPDWEIPPWIELQLPEPTVDELPI